MQSEADWSFFPVRFVLAGIYIASQSVLDVSLSERMSCLHTVCKGCGWSAHYLLLHWMCDSYLELIATLPPFWLCGVCFFSSSPRISLILWDDKENNSRASHPTTRILLFPKWCQILFNPSTVTLWSCCWSLFRSTRRFFELCKQLWMEWGTWCKCHLAWRLQRGSGGYLS